MQFNFENISIEQKVGQMIMVGFSGLELEPHHYLITTLSEGLIGGLIFFDGDLRTKKVRNIENPGQIRTLISQIRAISRFPLFLAVDQEGGKVARLTIKNGFIDFPSHSEIGHVNNYLYTRNVASQIASLLEETGFNTNFAPVVDIAINPQNTVILQKGRSFSDSPDVVAEHSSIFIEEHIRRGVLPVAKHFPGHGSSDMDSHLGWTDVTKTWKPIELKPYELLQAKDLLPSVMVAHVYNSAFDPNFPASLSHIWIEEILRKEIGFSGIVFSDDLQMKSITDNFTFEESIEYAINAGVDVIVFANQLEFDDNLHNKILQTILKLVKSNKISIQRIEESFLRIKSIKYKIFKMFSMLNNSGRINE